MDLKIYSALPAEAKQIREDVFVKEQGFHNEFDEIDSRSTHLVLFDDGMPIATCRFFRHESQDGFVIGRIAVVKACRGRNIGSCLLGMAESAIKKAGGKNIFLHAQTRAMNFYEKQGYRGFGEIDFDEDCPHIWMCKKTARK